MLSVWRQSDARSDYAVTHSETVKFEFDQLKRIISVLIITEKLKVNYIEVVCSLSSQIIKSFFHSRLTNMFFIKLVLPSS